MKSFNYKSLLFNLVESIVVMVVGYFLISIPKMFIIITVFTFTREVIGGAKHYKNIYKCMLWSFLVMESLFLVARINFILGVCITVFAGITLSRGGDIPIFEYNNDKDKKKYRELRHYIENNKDTKQLKEFEDLIINFNTKYNDRFKINLYEMYKLIFYEGLSYEKVKKEMNLRDDNHVITNALDMIFICYNTYIDINEQYKQKKEELTTC